MEIDDSDTMDRNTKRTSSGIFGTILAAPLSVAGKAYQNQSSTMTTTITTSPTDQSRNVPRSPPRKRGIFGRSNSPVKKGVRKMGISAPIVIDMDNTTAGPFARMQTVDLATAAASERERRENNAARQLVANRPAPQPPKLGGPEGLQQSISTRRKEIKTLRPPPKPMTSIAASTNGSDNGLSVNANASSTSASLSPGIEDIRRRSPRNSKVYDQGLDKFDFSDVSRGRVRTQIRTEPPPDSRRQNPLRSQMANQETVMYIKDIVYDQPGMVKSIMSGVPAMIAKSKPQPSSPLRTPHSSQSILNRPRPYKRESETDSKFFAGAYSPRHRRSKSGSSVTNNLRSFTQSQPGSPTGLPALPPLPTSASRLKRLLPNDTRSMTVDEKILLLFPAPLGVQTSHQRRSSVPSIPRIPSLILQGSGGLELSKEAVKAEHRTSKRTTISFGATPDLKHLSSIPTSPNNKDQFENQTSASPEFVGRPRQDSNTYRFSAHTYGTLFEGPHDSWATKFPVPGVPNIPEANWKSSFTETSSESGDTHDDTKSAWASLHSPTPAIEVMGVRANAIHMRRDITAPVDTDRKLPDLPQEADKESDYNADPNAEFITFALATEGSTAGENQPSFFLDAGADSPEEQISDPSPAHTWHHRLGDELPTFSDRRKDFRTRAMPPPPPLLLNSSGRQAKVVIKEPEPEVIDSPGRAIKQIQAQLKMFEGTNRDRDSLGSLLGHLPGPAPKTPSGGNADRIGLLASLEAEMGQQESHWMQMQHNFDRDSNSVMILSPAVQELREKGHNSPPLEPHSRPTSPPSRSSSTRSITLRSRRSIATTRSTETTSSSDNSRASIWQKRLAEAQMEFMENAPELQQKQKLNFLDSKKSLPQPSSPTPPESVNSADDSTQFDSDSETEDIDENNQPKSMNAPLWESKPLPQPIVVENMWIAPRSGSTVRDASPEPPAKSVRPAIRKIHHALKVASSELWSMPPKSTSHIPPVGLWGSRLSRPRSIVTRPKTQRPQRKSRRVTFLPDIVESPSPLPNKRDTLGIFQFPWGEKSDNAVYRPEPVPNHNLQVPNMLNSSLDARSRMLEQEEYESSFFDDYDDIEEEDSDDDFDESTLWEIGNLLNSKDVPSRNSLLPSARIVEDYDDSEDSEVEVVGAEQQARPSMVKFVPIQPLKTVSSPRESLWTREDGALVPTAKDIGLPQPELQEWEAYVPATEDVVRTKSRDTITLQALTSGEMWETPGVDMPLPEQLAATLWGGETETKQNTPPRASNLWAREKQSVPKLNPTLSRSDLWSPEVVPPASSNIPSQIDDVTSLMTLTHIPLRQSSKSSISATGTMQLESKVMWNKAITAVNMTVTKRTTNLWSQQPQAQTISGTMTSAKLWTAREKKLVTDAAGLFMAGLHRTDFRTSEKAPAALATIRKPRIAANLLSTLTSQALWTPTNTQTRFVEHNWISKATARPTSPSASTTSASSGMFTPDSDSISIASISTKVSSLWSPELLFADSSRPAWWESQNAQSAILPHVDVQKYVSKLPMRTSSKRLPPAYLSSLSSRDLWEKKAPGLENNQRESWLVSKASDLKTEKSVKKPAMKYPATKAQWDAALTEALKKSVPRIQRPQASAAEWKAALAAATGFELQRSEFNVAVRHPVFFTSSMKTFAHSVHPAMEGYVQPHPKSSDQLWSGLSTPPTMQAQKAPLWKAQGTAKMDSRPELFAHQKISSPVVRTASVIEAPLQALQSTSFWQPSTTAVAVATHWLHATKVAQAQLWNSKTSVTPEIEAKQTAPLWTASSVERPALFADHRSQATGKVPSKASVVAQLPVLESTTFWQRPVQSLAADAELKGIHWLHDTSLSSRNAEEEQRIHQEKEEEEQRIQQEEEEKERLEIERILNSGSSVWLQAPRHTLKMGAVSSQSQAELRDMVPAVPMVPSLAAVSTAPAEAREIIPSVQAVPVQEPIIALSPAATSAPAAASTLDALSLLMADLSRASINPQSDPISVDETEQPQLKRSQTLAPTGRKSIWTAPVRSSTMSISSGRRGSALWDGAKVNAGGKFNPTIPQSSQLGTQRLSRRMSSAAEEQQVAEAKSKIEAEGQQTWRPKWGLPEKPTDWLTGAGKRSSRVEFRR